jgi:hypothetical protein
MQKPRPLRRFWVELCAAVAALLFLAAAIVDPTWIESGLGVDPDAGSGEVEWLFAGLAAGVATASSLLARAELRLRSRQSRPVSTR